MKQTQKIIFGADGKSFISARDAAKKLSCAPDYVGKLCREGKLVGIRENGGWFVDPESIALFEVARLESKTERAKELSQIRKQENKNFNQPNSLVNTSVFGKKLLGHVPSFKHAALALCASLALGALVSGGSALLSGGSFAANRSQVAALGQVESPFFGTGAQLQIADLGGALQKFIAGLFSKGTTVAQTPPAKTIPEAIPQAPVIAQASTTPQTPLTAAAATTIQNVYPIRERIIERVVAQDAVTQQMLTASIQQLDNSLRALIFANSNNSTPTPQYIAAGGGNVAPASAPINKLNDVTITNLTVNGIAGLTASDIPALNYFPATTSISTVYGGTGITSYTAGDILYANSSGVLAKLPIGSANQILKVSGGLPAWAANSGGSGGASAFATTSDNLAIVEADTTHVLVIGATATSTTGNIFEVVGSSLFRGAVTTYNNLTAPRFTATSTIASVFPYASSTAQTISGTLYIASLNGPLQANNGAVSATTSIGVVYGGTGLTSAPAYGQVLLGNASGGYTLTATSSLGITSAAWGNITGTLSNQSDLQSALDAKFALSAWFATTTTALAEGSNLYYTDARVNTYVAASTTIAKTYTANTFTALQTINFASSTALSVSGTLYSGTASTTNLTISSLGGSAGSCLTVNSSGSVTTTSCGSGGGTFSYTPTTNFGALANATSTPIWFQNGLQASSTSQIAYASSTALSVSGTLYSGTASTSNLTISLLPGTLLSTNASGVAQLTSVSAPLSFSGSTLSITQSSASANGYLSSTDWNSFNSRISTTSLGLFDKGYFFSTTSASYYSSLGLAFSTTSTDYWKTQNNFFSTTSADYYSSLGLAFSTTSANYFANSSTTIAKTYTANTFTALQTIPYASSTALSVSGTLYSGTASTTNLTISSLGGSAGQCLTTNSSGSVTTTTCGSGFSYTSTTNFGALANATSTPIWFQNGLQASSTSQIAYASSTAITVATLFGTNATLSGSTTINTLNLTNALGAVQGGTGLSSVTAAGILLGNYNGVGYQQLATSSLGLLTTNVAEGSNLYFTDARVQTYLNTVSKGYFFATTSVDYWKTQNNFFSTTSADYYSSLGLAFSTTSANYFANSSTTIPKTYTANTFTALQTIPYASSTALTVSGTLYSGTASTTNLTISGLGGSAGQCLTTNSSGSVTTTTCGSGFSYTSTTNFGALANATSTPIWFQNGLQASSTSQIAYASSTAITVAGTLYVGSLNGPLQANNGVVSATSSVGAVYGGTGQTSYTTGDILYASGTNTLAKLAIGIAGQVLKVSGGVPGWGADNTSGGGSSLFATTTDSLAIYPSTTSNVFLLGASATTTTGNIFEVLGNSLFRGVLTAYNPVTAPNFVATSTTASSFPYASSTAITVSGTIYTGTASTTNLTVSSLPGTLLSTNASGVAQLTTVSAPLSFSGSTLSISQSGLATNGYLSSTDFNTFNNKISSSSLSAGAGISYNSSTGVIANTIGFAFTSALNYGALANATSTPIWFQNGLQASSTSYFVNADFTTATTTNLAVTGITSSLLKTNSLGQLLAAVAGTDYSTPGQLSAAFGFTPNSNYGAAANSTSTPIWFIAGIQASSTSQIAYASSTAISVSGTGYFGNISATGGATTSALAVTASSTVAGAFNIGGALSANLSAIIASTTLSGNSLFNFATTTSLAISGINSGSILKTTTGGAVIAAVAGTDYSTPGQLSAAFGFTPNSNYGAAANSTSTPIWFIAGIQASSTSQIAYASSTALSVSGIAYLTTASTSNLTVSSAPSTLLSTNSSGVVQATTVSSPLSFSGSTLSISQAAVAANGYLSSTDFGTFNNKISSTSLSGTAPITYNSSTGVIGFNTATANSFTGLQSFLNSSSTLFSVTGTAYFGGTATTTINSAGSIAVAGNFTGAGLTTCSGASDKLVWTGGQFSCGNDAGSTGFTELNWNYFNGSGIRLGTTTNQVLIGVTATSSAIVPLAKFNVIGGAGIDFATTTVLSTTIASTTNLTVSNNAVIYNNLGLGSTTPSARLSVFGGNIIQQATGTPLFATSTATASNTYASAVQGNYLYVADSGDGLKIYDNKNPRQMALAGTFTGVSGAISVAVSGRYAYVGDSVLGLAIVDVSNPSSPTLVGSYAAGGGNGVAVSGKYAFVSNSSGGTVSVVDISDPRTPSLAGTYSSAGNPVGIAVQGKYLYVANQANGRLQIADISNPAVPTFVGHYTGGTNPTGVYVSGNYAYVADAGKGLLIVNISNPATPTLTGSYDIAASYYGVSVAGNYAYAADHAGKLKVIDVSNPARPVGAGTYTLSAGLPIAVTVSGKYAYVSNDTQGLHVIDINGIESPAANIGSISANIVDISDSLSVGNDIYAGGGLNVGVSGIFTRGGLGVFGTTTLVSGFVSQGSSTISALLNVGGSLNANGALAVVGNTTLAGATSTSFAISGISSGSILKTTTGGAIIAAVAGTDYVTGSGLSSFFPFTQTTFGSTNANATSTLIGFTSGLYSLASSTIGAGGQTTGLTISGGATTTGYIKVLSTATSTFSGGLQAVAFNSNSTTQGSTFGAGIQISSTGANPSIFNPSAGNGLILRGDSDRSGQLRIVSNSGAWSDATTTTYFQINNIQNRNAVFQGGTYGDDGILNRLSFNASSTQIGDLVYGSMPVPISLFGLINTTAAKTILTVRGATSQSGDYLQLSTNGGTAGDILKVTSAGLFGVGTTTPRATLSIQGSGLISGNLSIAGIIATGTVASANFTSTGSSTVSSLLNIGGQLNANLSAVIASTTLTSNSLFSFATTTSFAISGISTGNILKTTTGGAIIAAVAGTDYVTGAGLTAAYPFALTGNATSTLTQFNGGLTAYASSTIGNGTQTGGLTIFGGATTTGNQYISGSLTAGATTLSSLNLTSALTAANGGTGSTTLTGILVGNGTGIVQTATISSPLTLSGSTLAITQATTGSNGYLSSTDFTTFNNKISSTSLSAGAGISYNSTTGVITNTIAFPYTAAIYGTQAVNATSTGLWLTGSPLSLVASSTFATFASTTQLSNSGNTWLTGLASGGVGVDSMGKLYSGATSTLSTISGTLALTQLAAQAANTVLANLTGGSAAPTAIATSSLFAAGSAGNVLTYTSAGTWVPSATTTFSGGLTYANGNVTNSGVTSNIAGAGISVSGATGAVTITNLIGYPFIGNATTTLLAFNGGLTTTNATSSGSLAVTASTTIGGQFNALGGATLGTLTLGGALTYGGVTLNNAVTGTGNLVLSASPTFSGTAIFANLSATGATTSALAVTGSTTITSQFNAVGGVTLGGNIFSGLASGGVGVDSMGKLYSGATSTLSTISGTLALTQLAAQAANTVLANLTGGSAAPTAIATSSLFAAGSAGNVLTYTSAGTWVPSATTTFSGGLTYANGNVTNSGVTSNIAGAGISVSGATGAVTITNLIGYPFIGNATTTLLAFNGGLTAVGATTTALAVTGSTTISSVLNIGGQLNANLSAIIASTTLSGNSLFSFATSTSLAISGISSGSILKTTTGGAIIAAVANVDYSAFAFPYTQTTFGSTNANATSTLLGFTAGLYSLASSTIGNGTQAGGLTISGGATTTGNAYFAGNVGIATTSAGSTLSVTGNIYSSGFYNTSGTTGGYSIDGSLILQASSSVSSVFLGKGAGIATNGSSGYNTFLGWNAGNLVTTGANNILLGAASTAANENLTTGSGNIKIGYNISLPSATANNQLNIGNLLYGRNLDGSAQTYSTGQLGVGSTSPYARLSVQANNGDTNLNLFAIGSSTASATTTLFSVSNTGLVTGGNFSFSSGTTTNLAVTASSTIAGAFNVGGQLSANLSAVIASTTLSGNSLFSFATSTSFAISGISSGSILKTTTGGAIIAAVAGTDYVTGSGLSSFFPFTQTTFGSTNANATSTLIGFTQGIYALASSTIGNGTQAGGLTISGGATTTGNAYFAGNVGIGSSTPTAKLSIKGTGTGSSVSLLITGSTGITTFTVLDDGYASTTNLTASGRVTSPLLVGGNVVNNTLTLQSTLANNSTADAIIFKGGNGGGQGSPGELARIDTLGRLGLGVTSPTYTLDVLGNGHFTTYVDASHFVATSISATSYFGGTVGVATSSPFAKFSIAANNGDTATTLFAIGSSTATATTTLFSVSNAGNATLSGVLTVSSCVGCGGSGTTGQVTYFTGTDTAAGTSTLFIATSGNVGVGTTSPFTKFGIHAKATDSLINNTVFAIGSSTATATTTLFSVGNTGNATILGSYTAGAGNVITPSYGFSDSSGIYQPATAELAFSGGGSERMRIASGGNIGIGTTTPFSKLDVLGLSGGGTADVLSLINGDSSTSTAARLLFRTQAAGGAATSTAAITSVLTQNYTTGKGDLIFSVLQSGVLTEAARIVSNGNVGIGTASPTQKLHVNGNVVGTNIMSVNCQAGYTVTGFDASGNITCAVVPTASTTAAAVKELSFGNTASRLNTYFTTVNGEVFSAGINSNSELGNADLTSRSTPVSVGFPAGKIASSTTAHSQGAITVMTDGTAYAWGYNGYGQLGVGDTTARSTPTPVKNLTNIQKIVNSSAHGYNDTISTTCALTTTGLLYCWGYNGYGQIGDYTTTDRSTPVQVATTTGTIIDVDMADNRYGHVCILNSNKDIYCWGYNAYGQLGIGGTTNQSSPQLVSTSTSALASSTGSISLGGGGSAGRTCAIKTTGLLYCWGYNGHGQLGFGDTTARQTPFAVPGASSTIKVFTGGGDYGTTFYIATTSTSGSLGGSVYAAGYNGYGQLGDHSVTQRTSFVPTATTTGVITYVESSGSGSYGTTCLLNSIGLVYCFGYNGNGQTGYGGTSDNRHGVFSGLLGTGDTGAVPGLNNITQVASAGYSNTGEFCALSGAGMVKCWGYNDNGEVPADLAASFVQSTPATIIIQGSTNIGYWDKKNAHLYYLQGNVGIGTTTPTGKLSITGTGSGTGAGLLVTDINQNTNFTVLDNGNVGVGTTTPYAKLSVAGHVVAQYFTATTTATSTLSSLMVTSLAVGSQTGILQTLSGAVSATTSISTAYGGTGISTYAAGDILYASDANTLTRLAKGTNGQVLKLSAGLPSWDTDLSGAGGSGTSPWATTTNSKVIYPADTTSVVVVGSNATTTTTNVLEIYGKSYFSDSVGIGSTSPWAKFSINSSSLGASPAFAIGSSTGTQFVVSNGGKVGIGSSTPYAQLGVTKTASEAQLSLAYDASTYTDFRTDATGNLWILPAGSAGGSVYLPSDNLYVCSGGSLTSNACPTGSPSGTGNLVVASKVGIGTSTPNSNLTIAGTRPSIDITDTGAGANLKHWLISSQGGNLYIGTSTDAYATSSIAAITITNAGRVGIGTTTPSKQFSIADLLYVGASGTTTAGVATSTFQGDIRIIGKLDVSTIDPVYTIDGVKYATYGHSTIGIHEETLQTIALTDKDESGKYTYRIAFDELEKGSDLWLFYQVTDFGVGWKSLVVALTPAFDGSVYYEKDAAQNALLVRSDKAGEVSMRLTGNRYDSAKWPNLRPDQHDKEYLGHEIPSKPAKAPVAPSGFEVGARIELQP